MLNVIKNKIVNPSESAVTTGDIAVKDSSMLCIFDLFRLHLVVQ